MTTDGVNMTEDAEMAECEGDKVVTMMDVLQEQQEFEEDANAVLGASDDKNCTYPKGYIKRQAIYACLTCCPDVKTDPAKRAGVCLACSLMCHENHELVELYTKRNFKCDCGNPKFNSHPCQFTPSKPELNDDNIYNQNFSGLYCICHRPYPDPEATTEDDMIQCIICEDWLHASHLDAVVPANDQYSEMICKGCMEKNEFLHAYSSYAVNIESDDVDILTTNGNKADSLCNGDVCKETVMNGDVETNSETAAIVPNAADVDMLDSKDKNLDEKRNDDGLNVPSDATEQTTELNNTASTEEKSDQKDAVPDNTDNKVNSVDESHKKIESQGLVEIKETNESVEKADETSAVEVENTEKDNEKQKEGECAPEPDKSQNTSINDKMESEPATETHEQKDEQITNNDKNANKDDVNKNEESSDTSKTEDQLLEDIRALTSDNPLQEASNVSDAATATPPSENIIKEAKDVENPVECSEKEESSIDTEEKVDKIEEASAVQPTNDNSVSTEADAVSTTSNIEVPDTSQENDVRLESTDDKTDSVMDAIDELLKGPVENQPDKELVASKEDADNSEISKENEIEMSESENKPDSVPEKSDNKEEINTDVEMPENKTPDEPLQSENKTPLDTESTKSSDVDKIDNSHSKNDMSSEVDGNPSVLETEKEMNGDITENETDNKTVAGDDKTSNNETSNEEIKLTEESETTNEHKRKLSAELTEESETTNEHKRKLSAELTEETSPKKIKLDNNCTRPKGNKKVYKGATFWPSNFRQKLCTCGTCLSMYKDLHVLFLTDSEDTVSFYENLGKENVDGGASQYEKGLQALSSLDRIQQINALTEYNKMRDKLLDFLKSFKDRKEIVKEEDIKAFFAGMKPKREPDGVYFCR